MASESGPKTDPCDDRPDPIRTALVSNRDRILARIAASCARAGRDPASVRVVVVTKSAPIEVVRRLPELGLRELGENRAQALELRAREIGAPVVWHMVGSLQTNKVRKVLATADWIHSLDRPPLAEAIDGESAKSGRSPRLLIEVNAGGEASKQGVSPEGAGALLTLIRDRWPRLRIEGLMTMAPQAGDPERARPVFALLRDLRDRLSRATGLPLSELSMGMSQDYGAAVEEGATLVRIGRAFFDGVPGS